MGNLGRFFNSGNAACISAFLIAIGIEIDQALIKHILDAVAAVLAIIGFITAAAPAGSPRS